MPKPTIDSVNNHGKYQCPNCKERFRLKYNLIRHMFNCIPQPQSPSLSSPITDFNPQPESKLGLCQRCKKREAKIKYSSDVLSFAHGYVESICRQCYVDLMVSQFNVLKESIEEQKDLMRKEQWKGVKDEKAKTEPKTKSKSR